MTRTWKQVLCGLTLHGCAQMLRHTQRLPHELRVTDYCARCGQTLGRFVFELPEQES